MNNFYAIVGKIIYLKDESFNIKMRLQIIKIPAASGLILEDVEQKFRAQYPYPENIFLFLTEEVFFTSAYAFAIQIPPPYEPQPESLFGTYEPEAEMEARPETLLWSWSHSAWERSNERTRYFAYYDLPNLLVPSAAPLRVQLIYFPFVDFVAALRGQKLVSHNAKLHQGD